MTELTQERKLQLNQIAMDAVNGNIFTSNQAREHSKMVFLPLALMAFQEASAALDDVAMIYEYISDAGPRSVNGMPSFMSFKTIKTMNTLI